MHTIKLFALLVLIITVSSCTLKRDNPLDVHSTVQNNSNNAHKTTMSFSRFVINSDNNNDGVVNAGETVGLQVFVKNNGSSQLNKVKATITCSSSYVSNIFPTTSQSYKSDYLDDFVSPGDESMYGGYPNTNTLTFNVSNSAPAGTILTFNITITDQTSATWTDTFNIQVKKTDGAIKYSRFVIASDNNNDDKVNKGETVGLQVFLKNTGTSQINKVRSSISCNSSYVTNIFPTTSQSYKSDYLDDFISAGTESMYGAYPNTNTVSFSLSNSTPVGTVLTFNMSVTDESNNTWSDAFNVTVVATDANIKYSRNVINSDDNSDGNINPGETIGLRVFLKNIGTSQANKVKATISCTSGYVSNIYPTTSQSFKSDYLDDFISAGSESMYGAYPNTNTISFKVGASTPSGTQLSFNLAITDESNNTWNDNFTLTVH